MAPKLPPPHLGHTHPPYSTASALAIYNNGIKGNIHLSPRTIPEGRFAG